ncbi:DUF3775 domain-containing protein [Thalassococcus sp. S3]|uniref:DUF3775 domain-containing protein n=1 Tax=Thalassococcus sp. S3 TaxID=2017482 RepID=UPI0010247D61|nr:DUF3775 domain-containing protein [Thalassococcus sp. S3]QBF33712.1 hypothetical protein CFI11_21230 [Thalassococcus sp. S3]
MMTLSTGTVAQVILMMRELDRAEPELRAFIERMGEDEQAELVALMWVGRGSFDKDEWADAVLVAQEEATTPCADYLIGTPHVSDHLENGMDAMGLSASDAEDKLM